jgi:elongation factor Ts
MEDVMAVSASQIKDLRERTGAPMGDCKKALEENNGDIAKSIEFLQKKSLASAAKKSGRVAAEGRVGSYVHHDGKTGVLIEVNSESDFVAKTDDFKELVNSICLQIAAMGPRWVKKEDVPADIVAQQRSIFEAQVAEMDKEGKKPEAIRAKIAEGKMNNWYADVCLLAQVYVKDDKLTIGKLLSEKIGKIGENIVVRRFVRFELGEGIEKKADDFVAEVERMAQA